eukprot:TRINITY_DN56574_c0_g1_i1.p1 TRINITY_DN56574_c0_g1~~TRINITY_DN56574_c0_g1_i1.p1  ORF type:complete len:438 (+),score=52.09 TRINITY_DN56574_c0_g1_i1:62-1315(+)
MLMTPEEECDFICNLADGDGLEKIWKVLSEFDVTCTRASSDGDRKRILELVLKSCGDYAAFDQQLAIFLQGWFTSYAEWLPSIVTKASVCHMAKCVCAVAKMQQKLGKFDRVECSLRNARNNLLMQDLLHTESGACVLTRLASVMWRIGRLDEANCCLKESQSIYASILKPNLKDVALHAMEQGCVQLFHKDILAARASFERADTLFEEAGIQETTDIADLQRCMGQLKRIERDNEDAMEYFKEACRIWQENGTFFTVEGVVLLTTLGNLERDLGNLERACFLHTEAHDIADGLGMLHSAEGVSLLTSMGRVKAKMDDIEVANALLEEALQARRSLGSMGNAGAALLLTYLALVNEQRGDTVQARTRFELALRLWESNDAGTHAQADVCRQAIMRLDAAPSGFWSIGRCCVCATLAP